MNGLRNNVKRNIFWKSFVESLLIIIHMFCYSVWIFIFIPKLKFLCWSVCPLEKFMTYFVLTKDNWKFLENCFHTFLFLIFSIILDFVYRESRWWFELNWMREWTRPISMNLFEKIEKCRAYTLWTLNFERTFSLLTFCLQTTLNQTVIYRPRHSRDERKKNIYIILWKWNHAKETEWKIQSTISDVTKCVYQILNGSTENM